MILRHHAQLGLVIGAVMLAVTPVGAQTAAPSAEPFIVPAWLYPTTSKDAVVLTAPYDSVTPMHLKGSRHTFTVAQTKNQNTPPDWYPSLHPRMPASVSRGRVGSLSACGYCHLPDGQGRSENATLAGLSADYILRQLDDMKSLTRRSAMPGWAPYNGMHRVADSVTADEARTAAHYFARIRARRRFAVVERAAIPATYQVAYLYAVKRDGGTEPIDGRLIEVADDLERHELRDPNATYTAFVPPGSIAAGRRIAMAKEKTPLRACASCHGPSLLGVGPVPPIAGRSPSYLLRQLLAFRTGARATSTSAPMQAVASSLSLDEMIAVSAYAGSLRPSR